MVAENIPKPTVFAKTQYECMVDGGGIIAIDVLTEQLTDFSRLPLVQYRALVPIQTPQGPGLVPVILPADKVTTIQQAADMAVDRGLMQPLVMAVLKAQSLRQGARL